MITSMTGFGMVSGTVSDRQVNLQVRSVNSRYLDLYLKFPNCPADLEQSMKNRVKDFAFRGRVDILVEISSAAGNARTINQEAARAYWDQLWKLGDHLGVKRDVRLAELLMLPGVMEGADNGFLTEPEFHQGVMRLLDEALEQHRRMRREEGRNLQSAIEQCLAALEENLELIGQLRRQNSQHFHQKLKTRLTELLDASTPVDPGRLAQEVAYLADRADITEEMDRFRSHLQQFRKTLAEGSPAGKKLDFILQEMHRECNTMLSKSDLLDISQRGIYMKSELEKVREQIQNLE